MNSKVTKSIIVFVVISSCIILYIAFKMTSIGEPQFDLIKPTVDTKLNSQINVEVDSLSITYLNGLRINLDRLGTTLDSVTNHRTDIHRLVLIPHPNSNIDTLKKAASIATTAGLTVHIRN